MVVRVNTTINCNSDDGLTIKKKKKKERIAHLNTYTDTDTGLLQAELESLEEQLKQQQ